MRVTQKMIFGRTIYNINKQYEQYFKQNEIVSSGKRVNKPSDDPLGMSKILGLRSLESSLQQYKKNIINGSTWLRYTESALYSAELVFQEAKVLAEQMATGTYGQKNREMLAVKAEQLFEQLMQIGNTKVVDRYIFSGFKTDTQPFSRDDNFNIAYNGDDNQVKMTISQTTQVAVNRTGQKSFLDDINAFDVLRDLRSALQNNDQDGVQETLPRIGDAMNQLLKELALVGTTVRLMDSTEMMLSDLRYKTEELLSDTEDADIIEEVTKLTEREAVFMAALRSTAMITDLTLVNYL